MDNILESIKRLIDVSSDREIVRLLALRKYREKFKDVVPRVNGEFHYYDRFEVLTETKIEIYYKHGYGGYEYDDSFVVDLTPEIRDDSIKNILD